MEENGHQPENQFPPTRISSVFKSWFLLIAVTVSSIRKELSSKVTVSIREKNRSPIAGMKDWFKYTFPIDRKKSFLREEARKKYIKNGLYQPKNPFTLPGMKHLLKNTFPRYRQTASSGKKNKENDFHQQENVFLLKLVSPNFNNGFQHQKKNSEQKHTVSNRQKVSFPSRNEEFV